MINARCCGVIKTSAICQLIRYSGGVATALSLIVLSPALARADKAMIDYDLITLPTDLVATVVIVEDDISTVAEFATTTPTVLTQPASDTAEVNTEIDPAQPEIQTEVAATLTSPAKTPTADILTPESTAQVDIAAALDSQSTPQAEPEEPDVSIAVSKPVQGGMEANIKLTATPASASESESAETSTAPGPVVEVQPLVVESASVSTDSNAIEGPAKTAEPKTTEPETTSVATSALVAATETVEPEVKKDETTANMPVPVENVAVPDQPQQEVATISNQTETDGVSESIAQEPTSAAQQVTEEQEQKINEDEIILGWATAWSNNDVEQYLSFYARDFKPSDPALDRESWEQLRRKRLKNQQIKIIVSNAEIYRADSNTAEIRFTQRYTSKGYRDRVIKSIEMIETAEGWKFLSERTLEELPFK